MIKKSPAFAVILLIVSFASAQKQNLTIEFIGYDGRSPIFASIEWDRGIGIGHNGIYKYDNGRLIKTDVSVQKGTQCFKVKKDVYVFGYGDSCYRPTRLQFKRNGRELFFEQTVMLTENIIPTRVTMNNEEFFIMAKHIGDSISVISRIKYHNQTKINTIKIKGYCLCLLDATDDHLYYIIEYPTAPDNIYDYEPKDKGIYRVNLRNGRIEEVVKNIGTVLEQVTAIVPHLNIVYSDGVLDDYSKNNTLLPKDNINNESVFFSYEHNAFVDYKHSMDTSEWECYHLAPGGKLPTEIRSVPCFKEAKGTK
jgi:hypothetical protein